MYLSGVKSLKENAGVMNQKWKMVESVISYYSNDLKTLNIMNAIKNDLDSDINSYIENFVNQYGREPDYDNESECLVPILRLFERKYYTKNENGERVLNYDYIYSLYEKNNEIVYQKVLSR